jgi:hypothetical protein
MRDHRSGWRRFTRVRRCARSRIASCRCSSSCSLMSERRPGPITCPIVERPTARGERRYPCRREAARRTPRAGTTGVLAMRPSHLRSRQAIGAVGAGGGWRSAGARVSSMSGRRWLDRRARSVRGLRRHAAVDPARRRGLSGVRTHRESGRLAQLEERRPYKAKVGGSSPSAPTTRL